MHVGLHDARGRLLEDPAQPFFSFAQRLRALGHALFERFIQHAQLLLCPAAFSHFGQQGAVGQPALALGAVQLGKDGDLRAENGRVHRLVQVIHSAAVVACEDVLVFVVVGREEDDRHARGFPPLFDDLRQLEAGHAGHADVEDEQREFLGDQREQRLVGGFRADEPITRVGQHGFEHGEVFRLIVHDQDVDGLVHGF